jgi:hypothetical protein
MGGMTIMTVNDCIEILIDLSNVDPELNPNEVESLTVSFLNEISEILEEQPQLLRESEIPNKNKPVLGALIPTIKALVSTVNIPKLIGAIQERFGAKPVKISSKKDGCEFTVEVGRPEDLDKAIAALIKLAKGIELE